MRRGRRTSAEQVMLKLCQIRGADVAGEELSAGLAKRAEISELSYVRWCKEYGGLQADQARETKGLERKNARLRRRVADLSLVSQGRAHVTTRSL